MTEPFLILHKVRGESAFDIAEKMDCPLCIPSQNLRTIEECKECDGGGYWWIIPTSGHRAYPYWHRLLGFFDMAMGPQPEMPDDLQDHCHYELDRDKSPIASSDVQKALASLIKPQAPLIRRRL